ncbi:MAG TPA: serine hydrolase [Pyrinomonadaceae bacterium]|nr:serine hydrolase [Pyrinomonadaceae bacterium]
MKQKVNRCLRALCLVVACLSSNVSSFAQDIAYDVDAFMRSAIERSHFRGSILIAREGRVLVRKGYGMADAEHEVANNARTKFRIGSLTKQFTAMSILMLQEQGKLNVQDSLCTYLPWCPAGWQPLTIRHLLTHTSGIPDVGYTQVQISSMSVTNTLEQLKDKPLEFKVGKIFRYSSTNYILLGHVIERASGKSYQAFLQKHIFGPLGMKDTGCDDNRLTLKNRATGYSLRGSRPVRAAHVDMSLPFSAGALYSTVEDLYKWDRALYTERLVSRRTLDVMFSPGKGNYGYGWYVENQSGSRLISHSGWLDGFHSYIVRVPDKHLSVIVLSNLDGTPASTIARALAAIALGVSHSILKERQVVKVNAQTFDAYLGEYEVGPNSIISISREDGRLFGGMTGRAKVELLPESESMFFVKEYDAQIVFVKNPAGRVTHSIVRLNGRSLEAKKIK